MSTINLDTKPTVKDNFGAARLIERSGTVPAATASTSTIGLGKFAKGAKIHSFAIESDALDSGTDVTLAVGYLYDDTSLTSDTDHFFTALTIAQTGGGAAFWPATTGSLNVCGFQALGDGEIVAVINVQATEVAGTLACRTLLSNGDAD